MIVVMEVVIMTMMETQELPEIAEVGEVDADVVGDVEVVAEAAAMGTLVDQSLAITAKNKVICLTNAQTQKLREN